MVEHLPQELCDLISSYTQSHISWRYRKVLERLHEISSIPKGSQSAIDMPLAEISSWRRGDLVATQAATDTDDQFVRIIIDSGGIREIERFSTAEEPSHSTSLHELFVVEEADKLAQVEAQFSVSRTSLSYKHC